MVALLVLVVGLRKGRNAAGSTLKLVWQETSIAVMYLMRLLPSRAVLAAGSVLLAVTSFAVSLLVGFYGGRASFSANERQQLVEARQGRTPIRLLCLTNPVGGRKRGGPVGRSLKSTLEEEPAYGVVCTHKETTHAGHGAQMAAEAIATATDVICCVGGDGFFNECINGMASGTGLPLRPPLCIMAEGTGNGLATSLGIRDGNDTARALLTGQRYGLDLLDVKQFREGHMKESRVAALAVGWGVVAEHDTLAEVELRSWGWMRSHIAPLAVILKNKTFEATLRYRGAENGSWVEVKDTFAMIHACNSAWIASDIRLAPGARVDDGLIHLVLLRPCSRYELLKMFLHAQTGEHVALPAVEVVPCTEFVVALEPAQRDGHLSVDGELMNLCEETHVKLRPRAAEVYAEAMAT